MECVGATKSHKVTKPPVTPASKKSSLATPPQTQEQDVVFGANFVNFGDSFTSSVAAQHLTDYSALLEDPLPDMSLDDILAPSQPQWPWSDTPDWTLMDFSMDDFATTDQSHKSRLEHEHDLARHQPGLFDEHYDDQDAMLKLNLEQFQGGERF